MPLGVVVGFPKQKTRIRFKMACTTATLARSPTGHNYGHLNGNNLKQLCVMVRSDNSYELLHFRFRLGWKKDERKIAFYINGGCLIKAVTYGKM